MPLKIRISDGNYADRDKMIWNPELFSQKVGPKSTGKVRRQSFVNRGQQHEEGGASRIEIPVRYWPVDLCPILPDLIRLMVSFVVELLAHARNDKYRRISTETVLFLESTDSFGLRNDDECHSLAEASARIVLSQF